MASPIRPWTEIGEFSVPELQTMYDTLVTQGNVSYVEALKVGVTIEEEDIEDLEAAIAATDAVPLEITYVHLLNGSENHLSQLHQVAGTGRRRLRVAGRAIGE